MQFALSGDLLVMHNSDLKVFLTFLLPGPEVRVNLDSFPH